MSPRAVPTWREAVALALLLVVQPCWNVSWELAAALTFPATWWLVSSRVFSTAQKAAALVVLVLALPCLFQLGVNPWPAPPTYGCFEYAGGGDLAICAQPLGDADFEEPPLLWFPAPWVTVVGALVQLCVLAWLANSVVRARRAPA